jgi:hypothetical protein
VLVLSVIVVFGARLGHAVRPDSLSYISIAEGHNELAMEPFSARVLHPALVGLVSRLFAVPLPTAFARVAVASLMLLLGVAFRQLWRSPDMPPFLPAFALFLLPWLEMTYAQYTLQDIFYAGLLSVYCAALIMRGPISVVSLVLLFALFLTRESTALLAFSVCAVYLLIHRAREAVIVAVVAAAGLGAALHFEHLGVPNQHGVGALLYIACKVPYNLAQNLLGMKLLVDSYSYYDPERALHIFTLPFAIGRIRHLAFYGFDARPPLETLMIYLGSFGLIPALVASSLRGRFWRTFLAIPASIRVLIVFGVLCGIIAPLLGNGVYRYIGYAWPALTLTLPYLGIQPRAFTRLSFLGLHFLTASLLAPYYWPPLGSMQWAPALAAIMVGLNILTYLMVGRHAHSLETASPNTLPAPEDVLMQCELPEP